MQFKWKYEPPTPEHQKAANELAEKINMNPILASLLIRRGITTESAAKRFFRPQLSDLINPFLMKDMDIAVDRLNDAMGRKERILVYGDYDVDGCTAVALVYKFLQQFYSNIDYYIPDRYDEGYGISQKGLEYAKATGVKLIIILDCGIKAIDEIAQAKELGIDTKPVIVGPFTFLSLAKYQGEKKAADFAKDTAKAYVEIIEKLAGLSAQWIQFDEPALVRDLSEEDFDLFKTLY